MGRYAGHFCIRCPILFIFGFLGFLNQKAKWVLISEFFQNLGFSPRFACRSIFSGFLGTWWFVNLGDPFGYQSDYFCFFGCIGMRVASVLPSSFRLSDFMFMYSSSPCVDLCDGGVPHTSTYAYNCRVTLGPDLP